MRCCRSLIGPFTPWESANVISDDGFTWTGQVTASDDEIDVATTDDTYVRDFGNTHFRSPIRVILHV